MQYETLIYALEDGAAIVRMNRPEKMNALTTQMRAELADAVRRGAREARVVVLTGAGERAFCSGQDLGDRVKLDKIDMERVLRDEYNPMLRAIVEAEVPVVAVVNGAAAGAGANIALACDVVIAREDAVFLQAFTRIGLIPDAGGTYHLPRAVGLPRAMGAALFADRITGRQAADWGMIYEAVPAEEFEAHWRARVAHLAHGPTVAFKELKQAMRASFDNDLDAQLALEARAQGKCSGTNDFKEGVLAFLDKRKAEFEGR
ncbi:MAG: 2-(1,2-epoxy-1,2-dihydrophenyl)acetyl-CoA isomerase [Rhodobacterales bacterium]|nr:MAG: 2-(1,2-epoxy-1,2-dihydrophenyl)acetyl-CoA isomerase [Rhodobacterales bacterium]PIE09238.1 MAG: 2-(1,2-epoxy-1,2-dihydrophenyl)acetyl-CoA isomerase [Rhodobacterales bacterium]